MSVSDLLVNVDRTVHELEALAQFSDVKAPAVTRIVFSESDKAARAYLNKLFREAGLSVRIDAVGNIFARWVGSEPDLPAVGTGSHTDAIPHSGRYDGTVGVLGGLEAIRTLQRTGFQPRRSIELVMFTSEEPTRYGIGCLGSRLMAGVLDPIAASQFTDKTGVSLEQTLADFGCQGFLVDTKLPKEYYASWVELHIEQGPILEGKGLPIGIVKAIAAPAALRCSFVGEGGHAGAVLMKGRKDAFLGAAELALSVERHALLLGSADTVATTGFVQVHPGAANSIPSRVNLEIDVRDIDAGRRNRVLDAIRSSAQGIADSRDLSVELSMINADPPAQSAPKITAAIRRACEDSGLPCLDMISRAYHDTLFMAVIAPVAMVFIPCFRGYSHRPDEYASPEAIRDGIAVLARTLADLSLDTD